MIVCVVMKIDVLGSDVNGLDMDYPLDLHFRTYTSHDRLSRRHRSKHQAL